MSSEVEMYERKKARYCSLCKGTDHVYQGCPYMPKHWSAERIRKCVEERYALIAISERKEGQLEALLTLIRDYLVKAGT
jgi:hypothetical protein